MLRKLLGETLQCASCPRDRPNQPVARLRVRSTAAAESAGWMATSKGWYCPECTAALHERTATHRIAAARFGLEDAVQRESDEFPDMARVRRVFDDHRIDEEIGRGGMATVFRAHDEEGQPWAIKILDLHKAQDPLHAERFRREARILGALDHPNVVQVADFREHDGILGIVIELVDGPGCDDVIAAGPVARAEALRVSLAVCGALQAAHEAGVVHRDVKPANVLLGPGGIVKLADFGVAAVTRKPIREHTVTNTRDQVGSRRYQSPEQEAGDKNVDGRADVWGVGILLYEALSGQVPARKSGQLERLDPLDPELDPVLRRCLAHAREDRYRSMNELMDALRNAAG